MLKEMGHRFANDNVAVVGWKGIAKFLIAQSDNILLSISKWIDEILVYVFDIQLVDNDIVYQVIGKIAITTSNVCNCQRI